jgi:hypothetical protein
MRRVLLASVAGLLVGLAGATVSADVGKSLTARRAGEASFKLFGTSFCYPESRPAHRCDVALPERLMSWAPPAERTGQSLRILGVTFCATATASGPACDVVWEPPAATQPWRLHPEIQVADAITRP